MTGGLGGQGFPAGVAAAGGVKFLPDLGDDLPGMVRQSEPGGRRALGLVVVAMAHSFLAFLAVAASGVPPGQGAGVGSGEFPEKRAAFHGQVVVLQVVFGLLAGPFF